MKNHNPYLVQVWNVIPRILSLFDTDPLSKTYGVGDRFRWAWKLIDFGSGTFQGAANGLAQLLVNGMLPEGFSESSICRRIESMFQGAETLRDTNGSLSESFPFESSFCVTALVAYDLVTAVSLLGSRINSSQRTRFLDIIHPMIQFLHRNDERHAFISNHLATASVALFRWSSITGEAGEKRGHELLKQILKEQSSEGWFKEYEGVDPGYQSLCTYYLADLYLIRPDLDLLEPLQRSIQFLWHFAHPDGSFGGHYGSRNTRFYFPAGIEALADLISEAGALATFMRHSISSNSTVTLAAMDEPNLIPMFNAYCWAAVLFDAKESKSQENLPTIPAVSETSWCKHFSGAGLYIDKGPRHYTIISLFKGGVCYHFFTDGEKAQIDTGVAAVSTNNRLYSTQAFSRENDIRMESDTLIIIATFTEVKKQIPSTLQLIVLRLLNITLMRNISFGNWIKSQLVKLLITGKKKISVKNIRTIRLGPDIDIVDEWENNSHGLKRLKTGIHFSAIHMASQGYWQCQDENN